MKKVLKNMLLLFLILIVTFSAISPLQVRAAKKGEVQNIEMYVGETYEYTNHSKVKSIKNTKKSVVGTTKKKDNDKYVVFKAKKAGKAKITAKTQSGTAVFNITIKKSKFGYRLYSIGSGEILAEVTNKNKVIFEKGKFRYTIKGADGKEYKSEEITVPVLMPGSKSFVRINLGTSSFEPDVSQSKIKMVSLSRSQKRKYANANKKLIIKDKVKSQVEEKVVVSVTYKNNGKVSTKGYLYVIFYDSSGLPIEFVDKLVSLKAGASDTFNATGYIRMINLTTGQREPYDHYEIIKNVYTNELKK